MARLRGTRLAATGGVSTPETPRDAHDPSVPRAHADTGASEPPPTQLVPVQPPPPKAKAPRGEVTAALAAVIGGGLVGLALLFGSADAPPDSAGADVQAAGVVPAASPALPRAPGRWSNGSDSRWKSARARDLVLELPADNRVAVWMKHVRPMLVVRCMNRSPEVFVFTETAAKIETQDENHTVHISFDGQPAAAERWPDSVEHDALFAPDGEAFLRKLVAAKTLSFGFSPHNAMPVEVRFNVSGLDALIQPAAKQCGW